MRRCWSLETKFQLCTINTRTKVYHLDCFLKHDIVCLNPAKTLKYSLKTLIYEVRNIPISL